MTQDKLKELGKAHADGEEGGGEGDNIENSLCCRLKQHRGDVKCGWG